MSNSLQEFKDNLSTELYTMTVLEAVSKNICINCKETPPRFYSIDGRIEHKISGLCEYCFDKICADLE